MYPKVKVREEIEEGDGYDYGRVSLQSLKAFEWLSLDHYSSGNYTFLLLLLPSSATVLLLLLFSSQFKMEVVIVN